MNFLSQIPSHLIENCWYVSTSLIIVSIWFSHAPNLTLSDRGAPHREILSNDLHPTVNWATEVHSIGILFDQGGGSQTSMYENAA